MSNIVIPDGGTIGSASDTDAISISANGKPTFSAGIANTGTIDAGTLGDSIIHTVGWQHIKSFHHKSGDSATNDIIFDNVFSSDYIGYHVKIGYIGTDTNPFDAYFRFRSGGASGADHADGSYKGTIRTTKASSTSYNAFFIDSYSFHFIANSVTGGSGVDNGIYGDIFIYNTNGPTILGESTDRGSNYKPYVYSRTLSYQDSTGHGMQSAESRFDVSHGSSDYTGFKIWLTNDNNTAGANMHQDTHLSLFGLKGQSTA